MIKRLGLVLVLLLAAALMPLSALGSVTQSPGGGTTGEARPAALPASGRASTGSQPAPAGFIVSNAPLRVDQAVYDDTADGKTGRFLVLLRSQADVKAAAAAGLAGRQPAGRDSAAWADQGQAVFDAVRSVAAATQPAVTARLDALGATYQSYYVANLLSVEGNRAVVDALAARPDVLAIEANHDFRVPLEQEEAAPPGPTAPDAVEWNVTRIHAPDLWALGYTGQNIVVANADVGVQWDHPALKPHYRGFNLMGTNHNYNWWDAIHTPIEGGTACGYSSPVPCPDGSHGTHTTGTAVGSDGGANQIGVAPGAKWIACRNMEDGVGRPNTYIECLQFFLAPTDLNGQNANPALRADVVGNSYGCPLGAPPGGEGCAANSMTAVVQTLRAAGIFMSVSAGNDGYYGCSTVNAPPGTEASVITVGATESNDVIASYSSRGPVTIDGSNRRKPDVVAPGSNVRSSVPTSGYGYMSGTSMASPALAGAVAVLWSAVPGLRGNVSLTQQLFQDSATHLTTTETCGGIPGSQVPNNTYGYGLINLQAAYNAVAGVTMTPATASQGGAPGSAIPFTLHVANTGYLADTFSFSRTGGGWTWDLPANVTLAPGAGQDVTVTAHVPANATAGGMDTAAVKATSANNSGKTATSTLTATASAVYGVTMTPATASQSGAPSATLSFVLHVANTGNAADTFSFSQAGTPAWSWNLPADLALAAYSAQDVTVTVQVPAGALAGGMDTAQVRVTSAHDAAKTAASTLTATANVVYGVTMTPAAASQSGTPGAALAFTLHVVNTGNASDTFSFSQAGGLWTWDLPPNLALAAGGAQDVSVTAHVPGDAAVGAIDHAAFKATSTHSASAEFVSNLTAEAQGAYGLGLSVPVTARTARQGVAVEYALTITNTGNTADTFTLSKTTSNWTTDLPADVTLAAGVSQTVAVVVQIPADAAGHSSDTATVTVTSTHDPLQAASADLTTTAWYRTFLPCLGAE